MHPHYDVMVVGGGSAGVVAAIQAARAGARTLLVEKCGLPGGTMTVGAVAFPGIFFAWGRQIIAGIGWELVAKTLREAGEQPPAPEALAGLPIQHHIAINPALYAMICDEELVAAGADILYHAMLAKLRRGRGRWNVTLCTKDGLCELSSTVVVDCTGDANAVRLAGFPVSRQPVPQPATPMISLHGYDAEKLDTAALRAAWDRALAAGEFQESALGWGGDRLTSFLQRHGENAMHVAGPAADGSEGKTALELAGRALVLKVFRWLRRQPGLEGLRITFLAPECGVRETVVIEGRARITGRDYEGGRLWPDALCYSFYPIDIHTQEGDGLIFRHLARGVVPTLPRGAMLPAGSRFLIAAGRHISGDREAHSAYRVQASCMAMGQAAGAMAALAAAQGKDPEKLSLDDLRALLRRHGAVVPGDGASSGGG